MDEVQHDDETNDERGAAGPGDPLTGRRRLLLGGAAAAAAAVGVLGSSDPAAAANGQGLTIGEPNSGTVTTTLTGSQLSVSGGNDGVALRAAQNTTNGAAIVATTSGSGARGIAVSSVNAGGAEGIYASSNGSHGIWGESTKTGAAGIKGWANNGEGVRGEVNAGIGVRGISPNGPGVMGQSSSAQQPAVYGEATGPGPGMAAEADTGPALYAYSASGPALVLQNDATMPPASGTWVAGSVVFHDGLWLCLVGGVGAASRWVKLSSVFVPLASPVRVYDSRPGSPPLVGTKSPMLDGQERDLAMTTGGAVPAGLATAVAVNLTVTNTGAAGFVSLYKNGVAWPGTSSINWTEPGTTIANGTMVAVDSAGVITARAKSSCDVVIDVLGYYT